MAEEKRKIKITPGDIEEALKKGMPLTCASCVHFYKACAQGTYNCGKTACGGVVFGRDFPDYEGPIPKEKFKSICLMCGDSKLYCKVLVPNSQNYFMLCEKHKDTFTGLKFDPTIPLSQQTPLIIPLL